MSKMNGNGKKSFLLPEAMNSLSGMVDNLIRGGQDEITQFDSLDRSNIVSPLTLNWWRLIYMYKTHGVIQTFVEIPVLDGLRGGVDVHSSELDPDDMEVLKEAEDETNLIGAMEEAMVWARLFGGGAIIINTHQPMEQPLSMKQLSGRIEFYPVSRWELTNNSGYMPTSSELDAMAVGKFSRMNDEHFYYYGQKIHRSRVITIPGKKAPYILRWQLQGWGMSECERIVEDLNLFLRTRNVTYELLREAKVDVFRLQGLNTALASGAESKIEDRIRLAQRLKNYRNATVMDKEDEYEQKQITYSGLAEVMKMNETLMAAGARMPMTKLFGLSASGFNAGDDDIENYNAMIESEIRNKLRRPLKKLYDILCMGLWGYVPSFKLEFKPLRVLGAKDQEDINTAKHTRYLNDFDRGLLTSKELGQIEQKEKLMPIETEAAKGNLEDHPVPPTAGFGEGGEPLEDPNKKKEAAPKKGEK